MHFFAVKRKHLFVHGTLGHHDLIERILRAARKIQCLDHLFQRYLLMIQHAGHLSLYRGEPLTHSLPRIGS